MRPTRATKTYLTFAGALLTTLLATSTVRADEPRRDHVAQHLIVLERGWPDERRMSVEALASADDPRAVGALLAALADESSEVREVAVSSLFKQGKSVAPRLLDALRHDDPRIRKGACQTLGFLNDPTTAPPLIDRLTDPSADVRAAAAWSLGRIRNDQSISFLLVALDDDNASVRKEAAWSLGELKSPATVTPLARALKDESSQVRSAAASALSEMADRTAVPSLCDALSDPDYRTRQQAARALGTLGDRSACPALVKSLRPDDAIFREVVARALGRLNDPATTLTLKDLLSDPAYPVRRAAAESLLVMGDTGLSALTDAADTGDDEVKAVASETLASRKPASVSVVE